MKKLIIARQAMSYGTRRLRAGDEFTASRRDADILVRIGRASYPGPKVGSIEDLRAAYEAETGEKADARWKAETLERKIAEAKSGGRYERRDMRATE